MTVRRRMAAVVVLCTAMAGCSPVVPPVAPLARLVQDLRQQGLSVRVEGTAQYAPFFSVPAAGIAVDGGHGLALVFESAAAAAADAAQVSAAGQPRPTVQVNWISTPHYYRRNEMIVLYVGCAATILDALQATMGSPFVVGLGGCPAEDQ